MGAADFVDSPLVENEGDAGKGEPEDRLDSIYGALNQAASTSASARLPGAVLRFRDRRVGDVSVVRIHSFADRGESVQTFSSPLDASCSTYGNVAFVRPNVDVCGTAAGMFDTQ